MFYRSPVLLAGLLLGLTACGMESSPADTQSTRTTRQDSPNKRTAADANGQAGEDTTGGADGEVAGEDTDCLTFWLHVGHCESDDVAGDDSDSTDPQGNQDDGSGDGAEPPPPAPTPTPTTPAEDPKVVTFRIKAGTGSSPWNTAGEMVQVKVGQTLRIINDDTITHRLHTGGSPCPHGVPFAPGASFDCVVTKAFDSGATPGGVYDHIAGPTARFYLKASR